MYNILLTDDEQIVVDSLSFIIDKNFPEQARIFKASSGAEAVSICRADKIDIIFMDINMPGLNGLEAVGEIKQFNPSCVIIILSAFDRFQYAQEALALGAYRYLTKPVNRNLVVQTVRNAMALIDSVQGKIAGDIEIKEKLSFVSSIVESDFIYSSIFSADDGRDRRSYLDYFKISEESYYYMCIEVPGVTSSARYDIYMTIRDIISSKTNSITGPFMLNRIAVYVPLEKTDEAEDFKARQQDCVRAIFSQLAMKISSRIKIGVSSVFTDLSETVAAYNEAVLSVQNAPDSGGIFFMTNNREKKAEKNDGIAFQISESQGENAGVLAVRQEQRLLSRIMAGDISGTRNQASLWLSSIEEISGNMDEIRSAVFRVLVNARDAASEVNESYSEKASFKNTFSKLAACNSIDELQTYTFPQFTECAAVVYESHNQKENPVIVKVKQFIESHLSEDLSLEKAASVVNVNPFYLSKLFKDETGGNFVDFVTELRLEKAREFLRSEKYSIKEISHETGYSDQNYFSKIFRRKYGMTPTEYRNAFLVNNGGKRNEK